MNYKNTSLLLAAAAITILNFQSCSKYDDGPAFSLRTKQGRLVGKWEVVKVGGQNSNAYFGAGYTYYFEFESDGDFELSYDYTYGGSTYTYSYDGEWEWDNNKEEIEIQLDGSSYTMEFEIKKLTNSDMTLDYSSGNTSLEYEFEKEN